MNPFGAFRVPRGMGDLLTFLLFIGAWFALQVWVLPRFGVGT